jgi:hypothetical protein
VFGPMRLTYRTGSYLFQQIEKIYGTGEVEKAFYLDDHRFLGYYEALLAEKP